MFAGLAWLSLLLFRDQHPEIFQIASLDLEVETCKLEFHDLIGHLIAGLLSQCLLVEWNEG